MENPDSEPRSTFFSLVWAYVRRVPRGRVVSYGQISSSLPPPADMSPAEYQREGARLVGSAMAACPDGVPWHRVVNAQGRVSEHAGAAQHRQLLENEGVSVVGGQIDMARVQWREPDHADPNPQQTLF